MLLVVSSIARTTYNRSVGYSWNRWECTNILCLTIDILQNVLPLVALKILYLKAEQIAYPQWKCFRNSSLIYFPTLRSHLFAIIIFRLHTKTHLYLFSLEQSWNKYFSVPWAFYFYLIIRRGPLALLRTSSHADLIFRSLTFLKSRNWSFHQLKISFQCGHRNMVFHKSRIPWWMNWSASTHWCLQGQSDYRNPCTNLP